MLQTPSRVLWYTAWPSALRHSSQLPLRALPERSQSPQTFSESSQSLPEHCQTTSRAFQSFSEHPQILVEPPRALPEHSQTTPRPLPDHSQTIPRALPDSVSGPAPDVLADGTGTPRASPDDPRSSQILASSCLILATFLGPAPDVLADATAIPGQWIAGRNA